ncbi:hypothetical protein VOLCADRAFT_108152 [Volvox carteri f. nagariensis]|uniref:Uncharacterized protein n=1 Tax=Volvox carteri f. nagariensis TaxID=3068 RepID=D8UIK4_VOLCA|nr:uncharacterized protein VOLCADRAFT_108152 [Volvox carteri f. nagariensis]EFJ40429.1 hypothetical protein VOLCADRAFT_108152 [Volvox carteri f. nagariensis]|eukprot:XP_002958509.1 hypothetical protein VOLCADRAFT_108152 [Volvox carteri f. nagariensis]
MKLTLWNLRSSDLLPLLEGSVGPGLQHLDFELGSGSEQAHRVARALSECAGLQELCARARLCFQHDNLRSHPADLATALGGLPAGVPLRTLSIPSVKDVESFIPTLQRLTCLTHLWGGFCLRPAQLAQLAQHLVRLESLVISEFQASEEEKAAPPPPQLPHLKLLSVKDDGQDPASLTTLLQSTPPSCKLDIHGMGLQPRHGGGQRSEKWGARLIQAAMLIAERGQHFPDRKMEMELGLGGPVLPPSWQGSFGPFLASLARLNLKELHLFEALELGMADVCALRTLTSLEMLDIGGPVVLVVLPLLVLPKLTLLRLQVLDGTTVSGLEAVLVGLCNSVPGLTVFLSYTPEGLRGALCAAAERVNEVLHMCNSQQQQQQQQDTTRVVLVESLLEKLGRLTPETVHEKLLKKLETERLRLMKQATRLDEHVNSEIHAIDTLPDTASNDLVRICLKGDREAVHSLLNKLGGVTGWQTSAGGLYKISMNIVKTDGLRKAFLVLIVPNWEGNRHTLSRTSDHSSAFHEAAKKLVRAHAEAGMKKRQHEVYTYEVHFVTRTERTMHYAHFDGRSTKPFMLYGGNPLSKYFKDYMPSTKGAMLQHLKHIFDDGLLTTHNWPYIASAHDVFDILGDKEGAGRAAAVDSLRLVTSRDSFAEGNHWLKVLKFEAVPPCRTHSRPDPIRHVYVAAGTQVFVKLVGEQEAYFHDHFRGYNFTKDVCICPHS